MTFFRTRSVVLSLGLFVSIAQGQSVVEIERPQRSYIAPLTPAEVSQRQPSALAAALADPRLLPPSPTFPCGPRRLLRPDYLLRHLGHIKVRAAGSNLIWYFTDFLGSHPNATLTQRYFPAGFTPFTALPPDAVPPPRHIPGEIPSGDGLHDQQFSLARIECSDKYGGSLQLHFNSDESFEYDARKGALLWDLGDLTLDLYVVPDYQVLNTARKAGFEQIYAEFHFDVITAYTLDGSGRVVLESQDHASELPTLWSQINTSISHTTAANAKTLRASAGAFLYGAIHEIFQDRLTGTNVVAMMELAEHHLDIVTRTGRPTIYVSERITDIDFSDADRDDTSFVQLYVCMEPGCLPFGTEEIAVDNRNGTTGWLAMFSVDLNSCSNGVSYIDVGLHSGHGSDEYSSQPVPFAVDCVALNADATAQSWGLNHVYRVINLHGMDPTGHQKVRAAVEVRLSLQNR